jgi:hypothetical protein
LILIADRYYEIAFLLRKLIGRWSLLGRSLSAVHMIVAAALNRSGR